jgi:hypothetical protein
MPRMNHHSLAVNSFYLSTCCPSQTCKAIPASISFSFCCGNTSPSALSQRYVKLCYCIVTLRSDTEEPLKQTGWDKRHLSYICWKSDLHSVQRGYNKHIWENHKTLNSAQKWNDRPLPQLTCKILLRVLYGDYRLGFGLVIGFTKHVQIATANNYSAIANSHTLHFTTVRMKSSESTLSSLMASASVFKFILTGDSVTTNKLDCHLKNQLICRF